MPNTRAQAALEYLTTYGFALVIIAIVAGVLIFMGIIRIPTSSACLGLEKLAYADHALDANGNFALYLSNGTGYRITDINAGASGDFSSGSICSISSAAINPSADFNIVCTGTGILQGQSYSGIIEITYKMGRLGMHTERADCTGTGSGAAVISVPPSAPTGILYLNSKFWTTTMYSNSRKLARSPDGLILYLVYEDGNGTKSDVYFTQSSNNGSTWATPINLSSNSGSSRFPAIAVASNETIHVVWDDDTAFGTPKQEIYYKNCSSGCTVIENWSADLNLSRTDYSSIYPSIAVDSDNNVNVVWQDYESAFQFEIYFKKCANNCNNYANWGTTADLTDNATSSNSPVIAVSSDKNMHVVWRDYNGSQWDVWYKTCKYDCANASKWSASVNINNAPTNSLYPVIAADVGNNKHLVWQEDLPNNPEVLYKICQAGSDCSNASNWSSDFNVSNMRKDSIYPTIAADSSNNAYVVWMDNNANNNYDIFYRKRSSSGVWDSNINKSSNNFGNGYPNLRVSSSPGTRIEYVWTYGTAADFNVLYYGENV